MKNKEKQKKGFTLIELIVVMAIISVLVLFATPKFIGYAEKARLTEIKNNIKQLETVSELYYMDNNELPIKLDSEILNLENAINIKGEKLIPSVGDIYHNIDYDSLAKYFKKPRNSDKYIIEKNSGKVYFLYDKNFLNPTKPTDPIEPTDPTDQDYTINVLKGSVLAKEGDIATVKADDIAYKDFENWTSDVPLEIISGSLNHPKFSFKMPKQNVNLVANYKDTIYKLATDNDFAKIEYKDLFDDTYSGYFYQYIGVDGYVEVPAVIKGETITNTDFMFYQTSVKGVKLNNPNIVSMMSMFSEATSTSLDLRYLDTSNVTNMVGMFYGAKVRTLDVSNFNTSNVTLMPGMFSGLVIDKLDLSNFDTSKVVDMSLMFSSSMISEIDLSNLDTSNVTNMSWMFSRLVIDELDLRNFNTSNVVDMSFMFYRSEAKSLNLSSFDTRKVTSMNQMFSYSKATSLDLSSFDTGNVIDMYGMFNNSEATFLDLSNFDTSNDIYMNFMFDDAKASIAYVRSQADADNFKDTNGFPATLNLIIK